MTSSTSGSEDPWAPPAAPALVLGLGLALGVLGLGAVAVRRLAATVGNPRADRAVLELRALPEVVVVGNSVAQSAVDPAALGQATGRTVGLAAVEGAKGPHAAALLRHHPLSQGSTVVLYMPLHNLLAGELPGAGDRALLLELLTGPDEPLTALALGSAVGRWEVWRRDQGRARDAVLGGAARLPARVIGGLMGLPPSKEDALAGLDAGSAPNLRPQGGVPVAAPRLEEEPPVRSAPGSALPLVLEATSRAQARLVVVVPAEREAVGAPCRPAPEEEALAWLLAQNAAVVDLRGGPLSAGDFSREYHLHDAARPQATALLARMLAQAQPGAWHSAACLDARP